MQLEACYLGNAEMLAEAVLVLQMQNFPEACTVPALPERRRKEIKPTPPHQLAIRLLYARCLVSVDSQLPASLVPNVWLCQVRGTRCWAKGEHVVLFGFRSFIWQGRAFKSNIVETTGF